MKRIYKTMQGKEVDIDAIMARNEHVPAVGNIRVNARGDEIDATGRIVRRREDIVNDHYNGKAEQ